MKKNKQVMPFRKSIVFKLLLAVILIFIAMTLILNFVINKRQEVLMSEIGDQLEIALEDSREGENVLLVVDDAQIRSTLEFRVYSFLAMLTTILSGSFIFYLVIMRVMEPLKTLTKQVSRIDIDNMESLRNEIATTKGGYEIEELSRSFDATLAKIYEGYEKQREFSVNVAHELRTPLAVLRTKIDVFKKKAEQNNQDIEAFVATMENNVIRLSELVEGILFLSMDEPLKLSEVHVKGLLEEILFDVEEAAKAKEVSLTIQGDSPLIRTDDMLLERALLNLVENAIKYNVRGGFVEITLCDLETEVQVKIADTGIGISEEEKKHIFNLFCRVEESRNRKTGGYGIGLALALNIVTRLGGSISVCDHSPRGSMFQVTLKK